MKKVLLFIVMLVSASVIFAQTATLKVGDVDITGIPIGGDVIVPVLIPEIIDGTLYTLQMFVAFDHAIFTWKGSFANPLTGIQNFHPNFPYGTPNGSWMFNDNGTEVACIWDDPMIFHTMPSPGYFYEMIFTYNGGLNPGESSPFVWGTFAKDEGGKLEKGATELYDQNFNQYTLTLLSGSAFIPLAGKTWTGAVDSDWNTAGNWSPVGVPIATDDVEIPAGPVNQPIINTWLTLFEVDDLDIQGSLTLGGNGYLNAYGLTVCDGSLVILSSGAISGSFIDNGIDPASMGTFTFVRDMLGTGNGGLDPNGWHYISTPVTGFESDMILDYYLNTWSEPASSWIQHSGSSVPAPCGTPAPNMVMGLMEGWSVVRDINWDPACPGYGVGDNFIDFTGPFTGLGTGNLTFNATATNPAPGMYNNWNLVGNPYPSAWYYEDFFWGGNFPLGMDDAMYMYDNTGLNYRTWVSGTGNANDGFVVPGQAVFFHGDGSVGVMPMTFTNAERYHTLYPYYKTEVNDLVTLRVTGNNYSDETFIRFLDQATPAFDGDFDAYKLFSPATQVPQIYTQGGSDVLAINSLPETASVPVSFTVGLDGSYTIEAIETSDFQHVVLEDLVTFDQTDLLVSGYSFEYTVGENASRFILHFTPLGVNDNLANSINIWSANQTIYVQAPATTGDIVVYNLMGQEVVRTAIEADVVNEIPMNESNTYYIVKVLGSEVTETGKVFIK